MQRTLRSETSKLSWVPLVCVGGTVTLQAVSHTQPTGSVPCSTDYAEIGGASRVRQIDARAEFRQANTPPAQPTWWNRREEGLARLTGTRTGRMNGSTYATYEDAVDEKLAMSRSVQAVTQGSASQDVGERKNRWATPVTFVPDAELSTDCPAAERGCVAPSRTVVRAPKKRAPLLLATIPP